MSLAFTLPGVAIVVRLAAVALVACGKTAALPPDPAPPGQAPATSGSASDERATADTASAQPVEALLPACGSQDWVAMTQARVTACGAKRTEFELKACRSLGKTWRCPADIRRAFDRRWGPDAVVVMKPEGGEWYGIVFAKREGSWQVIGFDGGDIP